MQAPKTPPRFLPTLTEVVKPVDNTGEEGGGGAEPVAESPHLAAAPDDVMIDAVVQRLLPALEQCVQATLRDSMQAHWDAALPQIMADLQEALRNQVEVACTPVARDDAH